MNQKNKLTMNIRIIAFALAIGLFASACGLFGHKPSGAADYPMIDSADIIKTTVIDTFRPSEKAIAFAVKEYFDAVQMLDSKKDAEASLPWFLNSIRIAPEPYKYQKYADALYATGRYKEASEIYQFCTERGPGNEGEARMGLARCMGMMGNDQVMWLLQGALQDFPFDVREIETDKAFEKIKDSEEFKVLMAKYILDDKGRKKALMAMFEKNFPKTALPYSIVQDSLYKFNEKQQLDGSYMIFIPDLVAANYPDEGYKSFEGMAKLDISPAFSTYIFRSLSYQGDTLRPVHHFLITIDQNDTMIAQQEIACGCTPLTIKTATIDSSGLIEVKEYARTWKNDPVYHGYKDNAITGQELKSTTYFEIDTSGHINAIKEKPVAADSKK